MFFISLLILTWILFVPLSIACKIRHWRESTPEAFIVTASVISAIILFIGICCTTSYYGLNVNSIAQYRQIDNVISQREQLMNKNLPEIKDILVNLYPQHEKEIFKLIAMRDIEWLWIKYPEIRAAETMQRYIGELNDYTRWYQTKREEQLQLVAIIEANKNSPFVFSPIIPTINRRVEPLEKD